MDRKRDINFILDTLNRYGRGYLVGGAVRDEFLGIAPKDYDFCTNISYNQLLEIFQEYSPKEIGKSFGIIQIKIGKNKYEIAKFRADVGFSNDRTQQPIKFTDDLMTDLQRRDFTINAIACSGQETICGSEHSMRDVENRTLRYMGDAHKRANEDPLRVLRAIRISSQKGLTDDATKEFINSTTIDERMSMYKRLSAERIREELLKIIMSDNLSEKDMDSLNEVNIFQHLVGENIYDFKITSHFKYSVSIRMVCLFYKSGKIFKLMDILKFPKEIYKEVGSIIKVMEKDYFESGSCFRVECKKSMSLLGMDLSLSIPTLLDMFELDWCQRFVWVRNSVIENCEPLDISDLDIDGKDLMSIGIYGSHIGFVLNRLLEDVLFDASCNSKSILMKRAESIESNRWKFYVDFK